MTRCCAGSPRSASTGAATAPHILYNRGRYTAPSGPLLQWRHSNGCNGITRLPCHRRGCRLAGWTDHEEPRIRVGGQTWVVGIVGAVIGGFVFSELGIEAGGLMGSIVTATVGAMILLFIVGLIKKV